MSMFQSNQPLWLPPGSVRALCVLLALLISGLLLVLGKQPPDWYVGLIVLVVRDYFSSRPFVPTTGSEGGEVK